MTESEQPLVSILIPCYNAGQWVREAIESALNQTYPNCEVIVVDDGSTDNSFEVIQSFGDKIRAETGPNRGGNPTRNRLLELAQGAWVQYLDADDYLLPEKIENQLAAVRSGLAADFIFCTVRFLFHHEDGSTSTADEAMPAPEAWDSWELLASWRLPQTGSPLWKRSAIVDVGGWKPDQPCCQEHELYCRMLRNGKKALFTPVVGTVYRQWSTDTVCKKDVSKVHYFQILIRRDAETYLESKGEMTPARRRALSQGHFECARSMWQYAPDKARELVAELTRKDPQFVPGGTVAPWHYRLAYRLAGFAMAERLAGMRRRFAG